MRRVVPSSRMVLLSALAILAAIAACDSPRLEPDASDWNQKPQEGP